MSVVEFDELDCEEVLAESVSEVENMAYYMDHNLYVGFTKASEQNIASRAVEFEFNKEIASFEPPIQKIRYEGVEPLSQKLPCGVTIDCNVLTMWNISAKRLKLKIWKEVIKPYLTDPQLDLYITMMRVHMKNEIHYFTIPVNIDLDDLQNLIIATTWQLHQNPILDSSLTDPTPESKKWITNPDHNLPIYSNGPGGKSGTQQSLEGLQSIKRINQDHSQGTPSCSLNIPIKKRRIFTSSSQAAKQPEQGLSKTSSQILPSQTLVKQSLAQVSSPSDGLNESLSISCGNIKIGLSLEKLSKDSETISIRYNNQLIYMKPAPSKN